MLALIIDIDQMQISLKLLIFSTDFDIETVPAVTSAFMKT